MILEFDLLSLISYNTVTGYYRHTLMELSPIYHKLRDTCLYFIGSVVTSCSIKTMDPDPVLSFDFSSAKVQNKIIVKSEALKEVFDDIDSKSEVIEIVISPDSPFFRYLSLPTASHIIQQIYFTQSFIRKHVWNS